MKLNQKQASNFSASPMCACDAPVMMKPNKWQQTATAVISKIKHFAESYRPESHTRACRTKAN